MNKTKINKTNIKFLKIFTIIHLFCLPIISILYILKLPNSITFLRQSNIFIIIVCLLLYLTFALSLYMLILTEEKKKE